MSDFLAVDDHSICFLFIKVTKPILDEVE